MTKAVAGHLSVPHGAALYIGALLGPGVLLVPGLATSIAGPAAIVAWVGLLGLSALFAVVFTALARRYPSGVGSRPTSGSGWASEPAPPPRGVSCSRSSPGRRPSAWSAAATSRR